MVAATGEEMDEYVSDSEAFNTFIIHVLDSVRTELNSAASDDKEQYDKLLCIVNPKYDFRPDEEALLAAALNALSKAVSKIDAIHHASLLANMFAMCIWFLGANARKALLELIVTLAGVADKYLDGCLQMLVANFTPPDRIALNFEGQNWNIMKKKIHTELCKALRDICDLVPLAPLTLQSVSDKTRPHFFEPKYRIIAFVECVLGLVSEIGETLGSTLLAQVVDVLKNLDVNIIWEDISQEDQNKGVFDMEIEDVDEISSNFLGDSPKVNGGNKNGVSKANKLLAEKLDSVMVIMCDHLKSRTEKGYLLKDFAILMDEFNNSILTLHESKFTQFVMFYACSLHPEICGVSFAVRLADIFISKSVTTSRMSAISYLGSYLARAKFISPSDVTSILDRIVKWCFEYCRLQNVQDRFFNPKNHCIFYSACQAVMYILCFRMRALIDAPNLKSVLINMPLGSIFCHALDPLKVCLPSIVEEFLRQAKEASLFNASVPTIYENALLGSELSRAFGRPNRLDLFFPFDPYLLKEFDRFIRPNFEFWSEVKISYSNCNSEEEFIDADAPERINNKEDFNVYYINNNDDNDSGNEEEEMGFNMDKMSITPQQRTFHFPTNKQMPTRIAISASRNL